MSVAAAQRAHPTRRFWIAAILGVVGVIAVLGGIKALQIATLIKAGKSFAPPPETVSSAKAEAASWPVTRAVVGTVVAVHGVTLGAELGGTVREINFESGGTVARDQPLLKLDTSVEEAQLAGAVAERSLARINLRRVRYLLDQKASPQTDLDGAAARASQADATVETLRATIARKTIRAPFAGRVGIRQVELGQVVSPGTPLVSLQSVDPIHVEFQVPQQALAELREGQAVQLSLDIFPGERWAGEVTTINPEIEPASRNVRVRATFANPRGRLEPGMFVNVEVQAGRQQPVIAIPATAVLFAPYGDSVFVLEEGKDPAGKPSTVARQRFVRTGERRGDFVAVTSGLSPGDVVVSAGAFKLRNGSKVKVDDALAPEPHLAPSLPNN